MTTIHLPSLLRDLVGGRAEVSVQAGDVRALIGELEARYPALAGRVRDERGALRPHVKIFVNGEVAGLEDIVRHDDEVRILPAISGGADETDDEVAILPPISGGADETDDEVAILPAISGGADETELLVGTRKGLIVLRGPRGGPMEVTARAFPGRTVEYAVRDSNTYLASVTEGHFGPRVFVSEDPTKGWEQTEGPAFPEDAGATVERIWTIEPGVEDGVVWAGVAPAALFRSDDGGQTWSLNRALWDRPERAKWQPGAGGLCLHSICPWPGDPARLALGISAAGVWLSDDGGDSWRTGFEGLVPRYLPDEARAGASDLCVHDIQRSPVAAETIYMQFHGGVYRSDDCGATWNDIGTDRGLPSDFGFPLVIDPTDAARAFVIPLESDGDRTTPEGKVRVFETTDRGEKWTARGDGLPDGDAFLTVLRQAFCHDDRGGDELGLYFGATSGDIFGSADGGRSWTTVARHLPPVLSVTVSS